MNARPAAKVLIVEDDHDLRTTLADLLRDIGYTVAETQNGAEAIDYLKKHSPPRLILLDLVMPFMDGRSFLQARLADPRLRNTAVFLMTAHPNSRRGDFEALSVDAIYQKPFRVRAFLADIHRTVAA